MARLCWNFNIRILTVDHRVSECWNYERVPSSYFHLYWHETPGAVVCSGGLRVYPEPSVVVLITPHTAFSEVCEKPFTQNYIFFNADSPFDTLIPKIHVFKLSRRERSDFKKLSELLQKESPHPSEYLLVQQLICNTLGHLTPDDFFSSRKISPEIAAVMSYIDANTADNPSNSFFAKKVGLTVRTLTRKFNEELGQSLHSYVIFRRIQFARQLLMDSGKSIDELAADLGFADRYHFSKTFKRFQQMTPAQYRKYHKD